MVLGASVYYAGNALITPTASALVSKHNEGKQGRVMGYFSSFGSLGRVVGPLAGGALYDLHPAAPYGGGSLLLILVVLLLIPVMRQLTLISSPRRKDPHN